MHVPHTTSPFQALYRVFVLPILQAPNTKKPTSKCLPSPNQLGQHARSFSHSPAFYSKTRAPEQRSQKWDAEITAKRIYLVDSATNKLSEPRTRFDILNSLDTKTFRLVQLSPDDPNDPFFIPVCKIVSKKESYEADKRRKNAQKEARKVSARGSDSGMKTIELNWAIDGNDLGHRLEKVRAFLEEGRRVEIVLAGKKGGRKASREECEGVLRRIREAVDGVEGARERRAMEGKIGGFATLVFQGKTITTTTKELAGSGGVDIVAEKEEG